MVANPLLAQLTVINAGFETAVPPVGIGSFQYNPIAPGWTFDPQVNSSGSGISRNNSGFTGTIDPIVSSGLVNANAPEGDQVAFVQSTAAISQSIAGFVGGVSYAVTFSMAQRVNYLYGEVQTLNVVLDGSRVLGTYSFAMTDPTYHAIATPTFQTTAGAHTITFQGLAPGDATTFIDNVQVKTLPAPASLTPTVSSGSTQVVTVTFSAPGGFQTLDVVNILINRELDGRSACYLAYSRPANALYIVANNGDSTEITGKAMDGTGAVGNSQCTVSLAGSSANGIGNSLTLTLALTLLPSFGGNKVVYAAARDVAQNNSGWLTMGTLAVPPLPSTFPRPVGLSPSAGNTLAQTITFTYRDQSSANNLQTVWALINTAIDGRTACYIAYYRPGNQLYLFPNNGDGNQVPFIALTGANTIENRQCKVSAQGAVVQNIGDTLTITLPITFKTDFAGFKGVWLAAQTLGGAQTSPWEALGAVNIPIQ